MWMIALNTTFEESEMLVIEQNTQRRTCEKRAEIVKLSLKIKKKKKTENLFTPAPIMWAEKWR